MFPSQIAWICGRPDLEKYNNLDSVFSISVGGSRMIPDHKTAILAKLPNLKVLVIVRDLQSPPYGVFRVSIFRAELWLVRNGSSDVHSDRWSYLE